MKQNGKRVRGLENRRERGERENIALVAPRNAN
jgi:hypothetical protein